VTAETPDGVTHWEGPGLDAWRPWTPEEAALRLRRFDRPWCVAGGWAIDLFLGEQTRPHGDLEIAIIRSDFPLVRAALADFTLFSVGDGEVRSLPRGADPPPEKHQNWVLDEAAQAWRMDVFLEPGDETTWICRRDPRIAEPRARIVRISASGIPYLVPEAVLLFKAKGQRPKDQADLAACLPRMDNDARAWLASALELVHPGHAWLAEL
jgi:hypothetical protein